MASGAARCPGTAALDRELGEVRLSGMFGPACSFLWPQLPVRVDFPLEPQLKRAVRRGEPG
jgi:hypothetical protein